MTTASFLLLVVAGAMYLAFAGAAGALFRLAGVGAAGAQVRVLAGLQAGLVWLPASLTILGLRPIPLPLRLGLVCLGLAALVVSALRPRWMPPRIWERRFTYNYFALGMALCVVWEVGAMLTSFSVIPAILAAAAGAAGLASLDRALRPA
jgi:hypothetical protein